MTKILAHRRLLGLCLVASIIVPTASPGERPVGDRADSGGQPWLAGDRTAITVRLYDYASTDAVLLDRAIRVATRLFQQAGVEASWQQCRTSEDGANPSPSCVQRADASVLQLRIQGDRQAKQMNLHEWQYGYAVSSKDGFGVIAGVFLHRIRDLCRSQGLDQAVLLGHVMAHELGHLLLGSGRHAKEGVMFSRWRHGELRRAETGLLGFSESQAIRMRTQAQARELEGLQSLTNIRAESRSK